MKKLSVKKLLSKENPEYFICNELNKFFSHIDLNYSPIKKINKIENKLSYWDLNLNLVLNPTSSRAILIGDAAHSIHPLAGQGLNLSLRDCVSALKAIENCLKFGNDLGDKSILKLYKRRETTQKLFQ